MRTIAEQSRLYRYADTDVNVGDSIKAWVLQLIALLAIALLIVLAYVWLHSETSRVHERMGEYREQYSATSKEVQNLQMEKEHYRSGEYIRNAVARFELELEPAFPHQVTRIKLPTDTEERVADKRSDALVAWREENFND
ncbi:MAG: hypothetical protein ACOCZS_00495 [Verrucomicrobiota bacterium]